MGSATGARVPGTIGELPTWTKSIAQDTPRVSLRDGPGARPCRRPSTRPAGESPTMERRPWTRSPRSPATGWLTSPGVGTGDRRPVGGVPPAGLQGGCPKTGRHRPPRRSLWGDPGGPSGRPDILQVGFAGAASPTRWYPRGAVTGSAGRCFRTRSVPGLPVVRDPSVGRVSSALSLGPRAVSTTAFPSGLVSDAQSSVRTSPPQIPCSRPA